MVLYILLYILLRKTGIVSFVKFSYHCIVCLTNVLGSVSSSTSTTSISPNNLVASILRYTEPSSVAGIRVYYSIAYGQY